MAGDEQKENEQQSEEQRRWPMKPNVCGEEVVCLHVRLPIVVIRAAAG